MANKEATLWLKIKETGSEVLDKIGSSLKTVGEIGSGAFAALSAIVVKSIQEFGEQEAALNKLSQTMAQQGIYTTELRKEYEKMAKAIEENSTFAGDQVIAAQAAMQAQLGQIKVTKELTQAVADYAAFSGEDLVSAAEKVSRSIATGKNALREYGIELSDGMTKQEKMAIAIQGLNGKFGGQAKAATEGLGGIRVLLNVINNFFEDLGERIYPVVTLIINAFRDLASDSKNTKTTVETLAGAFFFVTKAIIGTIGVGNMLMDVIGGGITTLAAAVFEAANGNFKRAFSIISTGYETIKTSVIKTTEETAAAIAKVDEASLTKKLENTNREAELLRQAKANHDSVKEQDREAESIKFLNRQIAEQDATLKLAEAGYALELAQKQTNETEKTAAVIAAEQQRLDAQIAFAQMRLTQAQTDAEKEAALTNIKNLNEQKAALAMRKFKSEEDKAFIAARGETLSTISTMQSSGNKTLASIGKAAALAQIAISAGPAISKAWELGPILGPPAAVAVAAALAAQAANVAGVQLAEGGIVKSRPGGIQATIGEGGQDEAVIPLDRAGDMGFGGSSINITVNGGLLGDQASAYEFAKAVDVALLRLRQNNESQSFGGVV